MIFLMMQRRLMWLTLAFAIGCGAELDVSDADPATALQQAPAAPTITRRSLAIPVRIRANGRATIHAEIFENESTTLQAATLLDIHGPAATGRVWDPLTKALFAEPAQGARVRRVITIDMFGHGKSTVPTGLPPGVKFGNLTLDDNVIDLHSAKPIAA